MTSQWEQFSLRSSFQNYMLCSKYYTMDKPYKPNNNNKIIMNHKNSGSILWHNGINHLKNIWLGLWEILNNGFTLLLYTATFNHFENICFDTCGLANGNHVSSLNTHTITTATKHSSPQITLSRKDSCNYLWYRYI